MLRSAARRSTRLVNARFNASAPKPEGGPSKPYQYEKPSAPQETRLASYLRSSPTAMAVFKNVTGVLGMGNAKQVGGRVSYHYYQEVCATRFDEELDFWHNECRLPPTFQTWFTVTNLHIWMLTVRFRALPAPYGRNFVQGLVDNFFLDIEDRIRLVLSPKAPERIVSRQMKILREQWAGLGLAFDYALGLSSPYAPSNAIVSPTQNGDTEMAAAVWRNLLGARGAQGIDDPGTGRVRRAFNISGEYGAPKLSKESPDDALKKLETTDDESGVHDFSGDEVDYYVQYPELMLTLTQYVRRELVRLDGISDQAIIDGEGVGKFRGIR